MRRILLLVTDLEIGGTPTVVYDLAVRLHEKGKVVITVASLAGRGPMSERIEKAGVRAVSLDASRFDVRVFYKLRRLIVTEMFDTVLSFLMHANLAAAFATAGLNVRSIQSIQTTQRKPRWHWPLQKFAAGFADGVVVNTPSAANVARERAGVVDPLVIPNAIDIASFEVTKTASTNFRVGFIGRLDPIKRVDVLIAAMKLLPRGLTLDVFGDGEERARLQHLAGERVTFHGRIADPRVALANLDCLVLPSEAEGFGLVLIEAMAAGVPVIASDAPGIRDVVEGGQTGLLVPVGDAPALAAAIRKLRDGAALRVRLIHAGKAAADRYDFAETMPMWRHLLRLGGVARATS